LQLHGQLEAERKQIESELVEISKPYEELIARLDQMPGLDRDAALAILGEIGDDMLPWADEHRFAAWAGLCPGNHESAGKRKKISVRKGNPFLKSIMVQAATAAVRTKGSYYQAKFRRLMMRRGYKRAIVAIAHSMLVAIYHMIRDNKPYRELGGDWLDKRSAESKSKALVNQLERLGYRVELLPAQA
jgi:transposase